MLPTFDLIGLPSDINSSFERGPALAPPLVRAALWSDRGNAAAEDSVSRVETLSEPARGWIGGNADFFRDARARRTGDLITVRIGINDQATLNNTSNRSRKSSANA